MFRHEVAHFARQCLGLALLSFALTGCGSWSGSPASDTDRDDDARDGAHPDRVVLTPEQIRTGNIRIVEARVIHLREYLSTTGAVSPNESRLAHIRPLASGVIEKVYVRRGDPVREGDPLILYDNIELGELIGEYMGRQAELRKHLASLEVTRKFWERGLELLQAQALAPKEVELREAQYKEAEATVEGQRSEVAKFEEKLHRFGLSEADIDTLDDRNGADSHRMASHNTLRAPFSGVIIGYNVAEGEFIEPSREVLTLVDLGTVWVLADVYEKDLGLIRTGQDVEIATSSHPDRVFRGRLDYISDVLEKDTRTARVRCVVQNPERLLKLEMFVTARMPTIRQKAAVAVPKAAIQSIDGQAMVFVSEGFGHFRAVPVLAGLSENGWIEVAGLEEGTPVVSEGSFHLKATLRRSDIQADED
jgi:cobalt-zinc-cadmium efflux system membrane fusion protein